MWASNRADKSASVASFVFKPYYYKNKRVFTKMVDSTISLEEWDKIREELHDMEPELDLRAHKHAKLIMESFRHMEPGERRIHNEQRRMAYIEFIRIQVSIANLQLSIIVNEPEADMLKNEVAVVAALLTSDQQLDRLDSIQDMLQTRVVKPLSVLHDRISQILVQQAIDKYVRRWFVSVTVGEINVHTTYNYGINSYNI
jgi:hypothetical protein